MIIFVHPNFFEHVIFWTKMAHLWLGVGAKVSILVSRLHLKNMISRAYANYTKTDKAEGLIVVLNGPKLILREEKVVIVFHHPPKGELTEEFECWAIHHFAHVSEEGDEQGFFNTSSDGGDNNSGGVDGSKQNPIPRQTPHTTTLKKHKPTNLCQWRLLRCWSPMHPIHQHWTPMMQTFSCRCSLVWLTMTINHCQRTFQHLLMKDRSQHNSYPTGSILVVASTASKVEGRTRHT